MKANVKRGGGFRGVLTYALRKDKQPEIVGGNLDGQNPRDLAQEFGVSRGLRPECGRPVWHTSLSLPAVEHLTPEQWDEAARKLLAKVGMDPDKHQFVVIRHQDADHEHVHLIASRIGLDGSLWHGQKEALAVQQATQEIEREMGLTLTKGPSVAQEKLLEPGIKVKISQAEREMWTRKGVDIPPKIEVAAAIEKTLAEGHGTLDDMKARLALQGIEVKANEASTGKISGLRFVLERGGEECSFTASMVHKGYSWANLEKRLEARRVEYEREIGRAIAEGRGQSRQISGATGRDRELAEELGVLASGDAPRRGAAPSLASGHSGLAQHRNPELPGRNDGPAGRDSGPDRASLGERSGRGLDQEHRPGSPGQVRPGYGHTEGDPGRIGLGDRGQVHGSDRGGTIPSQGPGRGDQGHQHRDGALDRSGGDGQGRHGLDEQISNGAHRLSAGRNAAHRSDEMGWDARFKQASAARRREQGAELREGNGRADQVAQNGRGGPAKNPRVDDQLVADARAIDPSAYLQAQGFEVRREGRHLSARLNGDEYYRATQKLDGHWVHCDKHGNGIGDNIALVRDLEPGKKFTEAVYELRGGPSVMPTPKVATPEWRKPPTLPQCTDQDRAKGQFYLTATRGISKETLQKAEREGFLTYCGDGVVFTGRDDSRAIRAATRRLTNDREEVTKRDFRGTDKRFPPILEGNPKNVWIVEGGVDALAMQDMAKRRGQEPPTVIVSGGANVRGFLEMPHVQERLKRAENVFVVYENEKSPEVQARTHAALDKQAEIIARVLPAGRKVIQQRLPEGIKDLAELNKAQVKEQTRALKNTHSMSR